MGKRGAPKRYEYPDKVNAWLGMLGVRYISRAFPPDHAARIVTRRRIPGRTVARRLK